MEGFQTADEISIADQVGESPTIFHTRQGLQNSNPNWVGSNDDMCRVTEYFGDSQTDHFPSHSLSFQMLSTLHPAKATHYYLILGEKN